MLNQLSISKTLFALLLIASLTLPSHQQAIPWIFDSTSTGGDWRTFDGSGITNTTCGDYENIIGGADSLDSDGIKKKFFLEKPYSDIIIEFSYWAIDNWDNDYLLVLVNGDLVHQERFDESEAGTSPEDFCGSQYYGDRVHSRGVFVELPCETDTIEVGFAATISSFTENYGIRDVQITGQNRCPDGCKCCGKSPYQDKCMACYEENYHTDTCETEIAEYDHALESNSDYTFDIGVDSTETCKGDQFLFREENHVTSITGLNNINTIAIWFHWMAKEAQYGTFAAYANGIQFAELQLGSVSFEVPDLCEISSSSSDARIKGWAFGIVELPEKVSSVTLNFYNTDIQADIGIGEIGYMMWDRCTEPDCALCLGHPMQDYCLDCESGACSETTVDETENPGDDDGWGVTSTDDCDDAGGSKRYGGASSSSHQEKTITFGDHYTDFGFVMEFYLVDDWDDGHFYVSINDQIVFEQFHDKSHATSELCRSATYDDKKLTIVGHYASPCKVDELFVKFSADKSYNVEYVITKIEFVAENRCGTSCDCCFNYPDEDVCQDNGGTIVNPYTSNSAAVNTWNYLGGTNVGTTSCSSYSITGGYLGLGEDPSQTMTSYVTLEESAQDLYIAFEWIAIDEWTPFRTQRPTTLQLFVHGVLIYEESSDFHDHSNAFCGASFTNDELHYSQAVFHSPLPLTGFEITLNISSKSMSDVYFGLVSMNVYGSKSCPDNAYSCSYIDERPLRCEEGYGLNGGACTACTVDNCKNCQTHPDWCDICEDGYYAEIEGNNRNCYSECLNDFFTDIVARQCISEDVCSIPGCRIDGCSSDECEECYPGYFWSEDDTECVTTCPSGQYPYYGTYTCRDCGVENCQLCESDNRCLTCEDGYYATSSGYCSACSSSCVTCSSYSECIISEDDSDYSSTSEDSSSGGTIAGAAIGGFFGFIALSTVTGAIIKKQKQKREERRRQREREDREEERRIEREREERETREKEIPQQNLDQSNHMQLQPQYLPQPQPQTITITLNQGDAKKTEDGGNGEKLDDAQQAQLNNGSQSQQQAPPLDPNNPYNNPYQQQGAYYDPNMYNQQYAQQYAQQYGQVYDPYAQGAYYQQPQYGPMYPQQGVYPQQGGYPPPQQGGQFGQY